MLISDIKKKNVLQWPALKYTSNIIQAEQIAVIYLGKHTKTKTVGSRPVGPKPFHRGSLRLKENTDRYITIHNSSKIIVMKKQQK